MKNIKWKHNIKMNTWEGTVKGESECSLRIEGSLSITDLREHIKSTTWVSPKYYKIIGMTIDEAKQLAEDLVTGDNFEVHEKNRLDWIAKSNRTADFIKSTQEYLDNLNENDKSKELPPKERSN